MTRKLGFTLAEVLITLGIIGVVAAMTIPSLMNQTGQAEFKTGMKKALSVLNQAVTMNVALDGNDFSSLSNTATTATDSLYNMFVTRMNIVATGTANAPANLQGSNYALFFNDGMIISFPQTATNCNSSTTAGCRLIVDVNGVKKPNKLSSATNGGTTAGIFDEFVFRMQNQQVVAGDGKASYILYN
jgi:prepilin-type N-terminal cleavage/methylation domain-containing protein